MSSSNEGDNTFVIIADSACLLVMIWILNVQHSVFKVYPTAEVTPYLKMMVYSCIICMIANRSLAAISRFACVGNICPHIDGVGSLLYLSLVLSLLFTRSVMTTQTFLFSNLKYVVICDSLITLSVSRTMMLLFYVYKAKSSQGLEPIFAERYFTAIFPRIIWTISLMLHVALLWMWLSNLDNSWECRLENSHLFAFETCSWINSDDNSGTDYFLLVIALLVEVGLTFFFLFLFLRPLHKIWNLMGERQQELKRMIRFNVILVLIGMLTSNVTEVYFFTGFGTNHIFRFDAVINVATMYLMVHRKRIHSQPEALQLEVRMSDQDPVPQKRNPRISPSPLTPSSNYDHLEIQQS